MSDSDGADALLLARFLGMIEFTRQSHGSIAYSFSKCCQNRDLLLAVARHIVTKLPSADLFVCLNTLGFGYTLGDAVYHESTSLQQHDQEDEGAIKLLRAHGKTNQSVPCAETADSSHIHHSDPPLLDGSGRDCILELSTEENISGKRIVLVDDWICSRNKMRSVIAYLHSSEATVVAVASIRCQSDVEQWLHQSFPGMVTISAWNVRPGSPSPAPPQLPLCGGAEHRAVSPASIRQEGRKRARETPQVVDGDRSVRRRSLWNEDGDVSPVRAQKLVSALSAAAKQPEEDAQGLMPTSLTCVNLNASCVLYPANSPSEDRCFVLPLEVPAGVVVGVCDGHGGASAAEYTARRLPKVIQQGLRSVSHACAESVKKVLQESFVIVDEEFIATLPSDRFRKGVHNAGCCANVSVITAQYVVTANAGDCRCILIEEGDDGVAVPVVMSNDHNCSNPQEVRLVHARSNDSNPIRPSPPEGDGPRPVVTRAIGDAYLKKGELTFPPLTEGVPYITSAPEVKIFHLHRKVVGLVVASDGIWDMLSNEVVAQLFSSTERQYQPAFVPRRVDELTCPSKRGCVFSTQFNVVGSTCEAERGINRTTRSVAECIAGFAIRKCAHNTPFTFEELVNVPPIQRRRFHDDMSAIAIEFDYSAIEQATAQRCAEQLTLQHSSLSPVL